MINLKISLFFMHIMEICFSYIACAFVYGNKSLSSCHYILSSAAAAPGELARVAKVEAGFAVAVARDRVVA